MMSRAIYKLRLISKLYAELGLDVMMTLFRNDNPRRYKTLDFPNTDFSMVNIVKTVQRSGFIDLIDTINIHPFAVPLQDITELEVIRSAQEEFYAHGNPDCVSPPPMEDLQEELWVFLRYCAQQEQFLASLNSSEGKAALAMILPLLSRRLKLNVRVSEYFERYVFMQAKMNESRTSSFHWKVLPLIIKVLQVCDVVSMTMTADSSMFRSMSSQKIQSTFGTSHSLGSLTFLRLEMGRLDYLLDSTWKTKMPLEASTRFNAFLACAVNLKELVLCYNKLEIKRPYTEVKMPPQWPPPYGDTNWLEEVLQGQHWANLEKFELRGFRVTEEMLLEFINRHKDSLLNVTLAVRRDRGSRNWLRLRIDDRLKPRHCDVHFGRYPRCQEYDEDDEDDDDDNYSEEDLTDMGENEDVIDMDDLSDEAQ